MKRPPKRQIFGTVGTQTSESLERMARAGKVVVSNGNTIHWKRGTRRKSKWLKQAERAAMSLAFDQMHRAAGTPPHNKPIVQINTLLRRAAQ